MLIAIVAVEGSLLSSITGLVDLFWITSQALRRPPDAVPLPQPAGDGGASLPHFDTVILSAGGQDLRDPQGRRIAVDGALDEARSCDAALIAGMALGPDGLPPDSDSVRHAAEWFNQRQREGLLIGAACAGTFVLGQAGVLDGRRCTTTWWLHQTFKQRFPKAHPVWGTAVEEQDGIITTGGPLSWIDLALHVIKCLAGPEVAKLAADISVADSVSLPQLIYAPRGFINATDPLLLQAEQIVRHSNPGLSATELAVALNLSERTLHRRIKGITDESPKEFITRVRIETACVLLDVPGTSVKQVAQKCGYKDESSFRRAFIQLTGKTPAEYKRWSGARHPIS